jgi:hypothetical protein
MLTEPPRGWREVVVGDHRTALDFAQVVKHLVDVHFPEVEQIVLVMDQLNIHTPGSLYEAFSPVEAKRLANRLEVHHTPKHGSWLNMAETELSVLTRQCLDRRIPDRHTLVDEVSAWGHDRNVTQVDIDWQFTTDDARIKLKRLYPARLP